MTLDQIRRFHRAHPFQAFDVFIADGRSVRVRHPENLGYSPSGRTVHITDQDEDEEIFDLLLVTSLKPVKRGVAPDNGH